MSKKKKKHWQNEFKQKPSTPPSPAVVNKNINTNQIQGNKFDELINSLHKEKLTEEQIRNTAVEDIALPKELAEAEQQNDKQKAFFKTRELWAQYDRDNKRLKEAEEKLAADKANFETTKKQIEELDSNLKSRELEINKKQEGILDRERALTEREADAESGFLEQNEKALEKLNKQVSQIKEACDKKLEEMAKKEEELMSKCLQEQSKLKEERNRLLLEKQDLDEEKKMLEQIVESKAAGKIQRLEDQKKELNDRLQAKTEICEDKDKEIGKLRGIFRKFGDKIPEQMIGELDRLREENDNLSNKLASSLDKSYESRLRELEHKEQDWISEKQQMKEKISRLEKRDNERDMKVSELEMLKETVEQREARIRLLNQMLEELQSDIEKTEKMSKGKEPFPALTEMDKDKEKQKSVAFENEIEDLKAFVDELQMRITGATEIELFYSKGVIRKFLGGLAMGKMTILQGLSGTGKTSLPQAFAKAVGGEYRMVSVQAGWRDRNDLIGYYNTFEKKYYESEFLKGLYEAQCPRYKESIYFIILDEMNLSHPEHYFADILSALEGSDEEKKNILDLTASSITGAPKLLQYGHEGHKIQIPPNIWFIGTANHDETTLQFAPKTYDRSNVIELSIHSEEDRCDALREPVSLGVEFLEELFSKACSKHKKEALSGIDFLKADEFKKKMEKFGIGWGNRFEKQLKRFIPVFIASGGTLGQSMDHIVTSKIFRNLKGRYDITAEKLKSFNQEYYEMFNKSFKEDPNEALSLIEEEIQRIEGVNVE